MGYRAKKFEIELRFAHDDTRKVATLRRLAHVCVGCFRSIHLAQTVAISRNMPQAQSPLIGAIARLKQFHNLREDEITGWLKRERDLWLNRAVSKYPASFDIAIVDDGLNRLSPEYTDNVGEARSMELDCRPPNQRPSFRS
jgi:hypothetical protein